MLISIMTGGGGGIMPLGEELLNFLRDKRQFKFTG